MKKILKYTFLFAIVLIITLLASGYVFLNKANQYKTTKEITIEISEGEDIVNIAEKLSNNEVIYSKYAFIYHALLIDPEGRQKILPGIHIVPSDSNMTDVFKLIQSNPNREITMTFPEGLTSEEILIRINQELSIPISDLNNAILAENTIKLLPINFSDNQQLEGFLFPDTYRFKVESTSGEVIMRFIDNFNVKWEQVNKNNAESSLDDYEILILASIIEKEANSDYLEKQMISDIFHKRLENGIPLGANSTLNYILDEPQRVFTNYEIYYPSDYNTYQNPGLPPTPICNPGLDSIKAAYDPVSTDYWYFLHTNDGETIYAKTLSEQEANIDKYL